MILAKTYNSCHVKSHHKRDNSLADTRDEIPFLSNVRLMVMLFTSDRGLFYIHVSDIIVSQTKSREIPIAIESDASSLFGVMTCFWYHNEFVVVMTYFWCLENLLTSLRIFDGLFDVMMWTFVVMTYFWRHNELFGAWRTFCLLFLGGYLGWGGGGGGSNLFNY